MRKSVRAAAVLTAAVTATTIGLTVKAGHANASERSETGAAACIGAVGQRLGDVVADAGADPSLIDDVASDQNFGAFDDALANHDSSAIHDLVRSMIDDATQQTAAALGRSDLTLVSDSDPYVGDCTDAAYEAMHEYDTQSGAYYEYSYHQPWRDFNHGWWRHWAPRNFYNGSDGRDGLRGRDITCSGALAGLCGASGRADDSRFRNDDGRVRGNTLPSSTPQGNTTDNSATTRGTTTSRSTVPDTGTTSTSTTPDNATSTSTAGDATSDNSAPNGTRTDSSAPDSSTPDSTTSDSTTSDNTTSDNTTSDRTTPDSTTSDNSTTDQVPTGTSGQ
ncbi:MAG TPA: hypothetical protein VGL04_07510 [Sporichthyaceae bacterium]